MSWEDARSIHGWNRAGGWTWFFMAARYWPRMSGSNWLMFTEPAFC